MRRKQGDPKVTTLRGLAAFEGCDPGELAMFAQACDSVEVPAQRLLSMEGRVGRDVLVMVEGRAEARREGVFLWDLGPGDLIGELSIAGPAPAAVTIVARTPLRVLAVSAQGRGLLFDLPTLARVACAQMSRQLRSVLGAPTNRETNSVVDLTLVHPTVTAELALTSR